MLVLFWCVSGGYLRKNILLLPFPIIDCIYILAYKLQKVYQKLKNFKFIFYTTHVPVLLYLFKAIFHNFTAIIHKIIAIKGDKYNI